MPGAEGKKRSNETLRSAIDLDAWLASKSAGDASRMCQMALALVATRSGMMVDVKANEVTLTHVCLTSPGAFEGWRGLPP